MLAQGLRVRSSFITRLVSIKPTAFPARRTPSLSPSTFGKLNLNHTYNHIKTFQTSAAMQVSTEGLQRYSAMEGKLNPKLLQALDTLGFEYMTPVQQQILNELPSWRSDCLVQAKTGTGKTAAFLLPTLHSIDSGEARAPKGQVSTLIITPTRELAQQIANSCNELTTHIQRTIECHLAVGGTAKASSLRKFLKGQPTVLVGTPGRIQDYLTDPEAAEKLANIKTLILDEADRMLDIGFLPDVKHILERLPPKSTGWQGMCFSATVPPKVKDVVSVVLKPGYSNISTIDENEAPTIERVPQFSVIMPSVVDTFNTLTSLLLHEVKENKKIIVFGYTAHMVGLFYDVFKHGLIRSLQVFEMHSRLNQNARTKTTAEFKRAGSGILFASDVVGRGVDFPNVDLVIQVGLPASADQYVHRVGRTGRAGNDGRAVLLVTERESFFIRQNRQLPIQPHPDANTINSGASACAETVAKAMYEVEQSSKERAYASYIGFFAGGTLMKRLGIDKPSLIRLANDLAVRAMACPEPPAMDKRIVGKMGFKGVPGLRYLSGEEVAARSAAQRPRPKPKADSTPKAADATDPKTRKRLEAKEARWGKGRWPREKALSFIDN